MSGSDLLNHTPKQRLYAALIEIMVIWEGRVCGRHLQEAFGLHLRYARQIIKDYQQHSGNTLIYNASLKGYLPGPDFSSKFSQGTMGEYLQLLHRQQLNLSGVEVLPHGLAGTEMLQIPDAPIAPALIRTLLCAAREQRRVEVDYVSLASGQDEGRIIVPHTLVYSGFRWHLRGWCEKNRNYRDFVLTRFRGLPELLDGSYQGAEKDHNWQQQVTLELTPNPWLEPFQWPILAADYGMQKDEETGEYILAIPTRAALAMYIINRLGINLNDQQLRDAPGYYQLTLRNRDQIRQLDGCY